MFAVQLSREQPGVTIVLEQESSPGAAEAIERAGGVAVVSASSREAMCRAMREHTALLGGGPSGRVWFGQPCPRPDALRALATLLVLLSQSDRALSEVQRGVIFGES
jgi:phosphomannomutase